MTNYGAIIAANVRAERARSQLSQDETARQMHELGFTAWRSSTISLVERGQRRLQAEELLHLADIFHVPASRLYTDAT